MKTLRIIEAIIAEKRARHEFPDFASRFEVLQRGGTNDELCKLEERGLIRKGRQINDDYFQVIEYNEMNSRM